jgi:hypothetical protein
MAMLLPFLIRQDHSESVTSIFLVHKKIKMKNIVFLVSVLIFRIAGYAQTCDIYTTGFVPVYHDIVSGETVDLVFSIKNDAKGAACFYHEKSVQVFLFLPETDLFFEQVIFPAAGKGEFFDWQYDRENKTLIGLNHTAIGDGQGEENIKVRVRVGKISSNPIKRTVGLSIVQYHDGVVFPSNDQSNDNSIMTLTLKSAESRQALQLAVFNTDCNNMNITFVHPDPQFESIEIFRSEKDKSVTSVTSWTNTGQEAQAVIHITDNENLESGKTYTYELVGVRADGSRESLVTETVENDCRRTKSGMEMFPNPVTDKVFIRLTGELTYKEVDILFSDIRGEVVKTVKGVSNDQNEVNMIGLPSGIYFVGIQGNSIIQKKRIVKIEP